ncbi:MAG: DNA methyltransferase [Actinomycetota bacterium]|nr:DNA methyltransferase [Actinomycetota bacterium]
MTKAFGINISVPPKPLKRIKRWEPSTFREQASTVWSFKNRGDWATHNGHYRGNWSPHIPRNVILKYSRPGEIVLDHFSGGGTTAVEAKLLGRRCVARDINPEAVNRAISSLDFQLPPKLFDDLSQMYEPNIEVGDARDLCDINEYSVDLICAHPPYADIIKYSPNASGDLSHLKVDDFVDAMCPVAEESFRVLKPGGKCVILIGDMRKQKHVVPLGFRTIRAFLDAGFVLRELAVKRQHNCKATGFWYTRSVEHNFLLLAHEYLPVFEKPASRCSKQQSLNVKRRLKHMTNQQRAIIPRIDKVEATTVWVLPQERLDVEITRNVLNRFARPDTDFIEYSFNTDKTTQQLEAAGPVSLVYVNSPNYLEDKQAVAQYRLTVDYLMDVSSRQLKPHGYFIVEARDLRIADQLYPMGLLLWDDLSRRDDFAIKEIIVIAPDEISTQDSADCLQIAHRYLLVFVKRCASVST